MKKVLAVLLTFVMFISMYAQIALVGADAATCSEHEYVQGVCAVCGSSVLGSEWIKPDFAEGDYTMVVLPDTQNMVQYKPSAYYKQMQWIADNKENMNILAVMNMGDMVNTNNDTQWKVCKAGTDIIDQAGIAWMPMRGNHDDSAWFNKYYDYDTFGTGQEWFGGSYEAGKLDHSYWFVTAGEREYMILSLGWAPSRDVLTWAEQLIREHSDKSVIINCHAFMNKDGTLLEQGNSHSASSSVAGSPAAEEMWAVFKKYENVIMTMSGHVYTPDIVTFTDQNATGRDVTSLLIDKQNEDTSKYLGMVAVLIFHNDSNQVDVHWYSTRYDAFCKEKNQFTISAPHVCDHQFTVTESQPTCTLGGGLKSSCQLCGYSFVEESTAPLGHDLETQIVEPGCETEGYAVFSCRVCDYVQRQVAEYDLTDRFTWTEGRLIYATNGNHSADKNWVASDYVDISDCESIEIKTGNTANINTTVGLAFYDANKKYISGALHTDKSGVYGVLIHHLQVPENAVYVRSTWYSKNHASYREEFGSFYCKGICYEVIAPLGHSYQPEEVAPTCTQPGYQALVCTTCGHSQQEIITVDITDRFKWTEAGRITATNGVLAADTNWVYSDYTDISDYSAIRIKTANTASVNTNVGVAFYDAHKNYISGVLHTDKSGIYGILIHDLQVPENAVYVRSTWYSKNHANYREEFGEFFCQGITQETLAPLGHTWEQTVVAPSCTQDGYILNQCIVCGHQAYENHYLDITDLFTWTEGVRITATNGQQVTDSNWVSSDFTDISDYSAIRIKTANTASVNTNVGVAFYDAHKNYISGVLHTDKSGIYGILIHDLQVPENAVYVRSTWYSKNHANYREEFGEFFCQAAVPYLPALGHDYTNGVCGHCGGLDRYNWILEADAVVQLSLTEDLYLNLNGYDLSGNIQTNGYQIFGMDSATDGYSCDTMGYFHCTNEDGNLIVPEKLYTLTPETGYMTIAADKGYTFHRYYLAITHMSLVPKCTGFGYKATFCGDAMVQAQMVSVGYRLQLDGGKPITRTTDFCNTLSLRLQNFHVDDYGETPVLASVMLTLEDGTIIESPSVSYSLRQMVELINDSHLDFSSEQRLAVSQMIQNHPAMERWSVGNLTSIDN